MRRGRRQRPPRPLGVTDQRPRAEDDLGLRLCGQGLGGGGEVEREEALGRVRGGHVAERDERRGRRWREDHIRHP